MTVNDDLIAFPDHRAAALVRVSRRRLQYWEFRGLVEPDIRRRLKHRRVKLYTFQDLVALLVVAMLRERGISLQLVRKVVARLRTRGYGEPLRELRFAIEGGEVYFQHPDGSWEGWKKPYQIVFHEVLNLEPLRARIRREATMRAASDIGRIERAGRGRVGNKPVFAGTRIPVDTVVRRLEHGFTPQEVIEEYPDLTESDIEEARRHAVSA